MTDRGTPNKKLLLGCGLGCGAVFVLLAVVLGLAVSRTKVVLDVGEQFVRAASSDPAGAYALLHDVTRQRLDQPTFEAQWAAVAEAVGTVQSVAAVASPKTDLERSVLIQTLHLVGERGAVTVEVDINPKDDPPQVVEYRLLDLPGSPEPAATP